MSSLVVKAPDRLELRSGGECKPPAPGTVRVRPTCVGICGSDYHFITGELRTPAHLGPQYPRVLGHEISGTVTQLGPDVDLDLEIGSMVALWPLRSSCGDCPSCHSRRPNTCTDFRLIGIHHDGGLSTHVDVRPEQVVPINVTDSGVAAFAEPMSIAVRALRRGRAAKGDSVVVIGAGPVGQAAIIAARDMGTRVLAVDVLESRLGHARALGADTEMAEGERPLERVISDWLAGDPRPAVILECSGHRNAVPAAVAGISPMGRIVLVGITSVPLGAESHLVTRKEVELLGSSVSTREDFVEAVRIVEERHQEVATLLTHRVPLDQASSAILAAIAEPSSVMKLVVDLS